MRTSVFAAALLLIAAPVRAQQVTIAFHDGQVSLEAVGASPRVILAEWSKVGGTNIVNGDRVTGTPLTLKLVDVPEAQALEVILKSAAGYMAAPRGQVAGGSRYDRILVLPTSTMQVAAGAAARPNGPPTGGALGNARVIPPRPPSQPAEEPPELEEQRQELPQAEPVFTFPQPTQNTSDPAYRVNAGPARSPVSVSPSVIDSDSVNNVTSGTTPQFGVVGAPMPGMIQAAPPPAVAQPQQPGRPLRPPGVK